MDIYHKNNISIIFTMKQGAEIAIAAFVVVVVVLLLMSGKKSAPVVHHRVEHHPANQPIRLPGHKPIPHKRHFSPIILPHKFHFPKNFHWSF